MKQVKASKDGHVKKVILNTVMCCLEEDDRELLLRGIYELEENRSSISLPASNRLELAFELFGYRVERWNEILFIAEK